MIYRPHPLTGVRVPEYGEADQQLRELVSSSGGVVSTDRSLPQDFADSDLILCDVSAVTGDWLPTGKPLIITRTEDPQSRDAATALLRMSPRLTVSTAPDTGTLARELIAHDPLREERIELIEYYLGDITPGSSLSRFLETCRRLSTRRDELWSRLQEQELA